MKWFLLIQSTRTYMVLRRLSPILIMVLRSLHFYLHYWKGSNNHHIMTCFSFNQTRYCDVERCNLWVALTELNNFIFPLKVPALYMSACIHVFMCLWKVFSQLGLPWETLSNYFAAGVSHICFTRDSQNGSCKNRCLHELVRHPWKINKWPRT